MKALVTEALDLDAFDESVMDAQIEYATVINNTVTFHFRDGHTVTKPYLDRINASLLNFVLSVVRHLSSQKFIKRVNRDAFLNFNWILGAFINCFFRQNESIFLLAFEENIFTKQHSVGEYSAPNRPAKRRK